MDKLQFKYNHNRLFRKPTKLLTQHVPHNNRYISYAVEKVS